MRTSEIFALFLLSTSLSWQRTFLSCLSSRWSRTENKTPLGAREGENLIPTPLAASGARLVGGKVLRFGRRYRCLGRTRFLASVFWSAIGILFYPRLPSVSLISICTMLCLFPLYKVGRKLQVTPLFTWTTCPGPGRCFRYDLNELPRFPTVISYRPYIERSQGSSISALAEGCRAQTWIQIFLTPKPQIFSLNQVAEGRDLYTRKVWLLLCAPGLQPSEGESPDLFSASPKGLWSTGSFCCFYTFLNKCQFVWSLPGDFFQGVCHCSSGLHIKQEVWSLGRVHSWRQRRGW